MVARKTTAKKAVAGAEGTPAAGDSGTDAARTAKKASGKATAAGKATARKAAAGKGAAKKTAAKRAAHEGTAGTTAAGEGTRAAAGRTAKKTTRRTAAGAAGGKAAHAEGTARAGGRSTAKKAGAARAAEQTGATTVVAKKTPGTVTAEQDGGVPKARTGVVDPAELAVRPGEDPWTLQEVEEARTELHSESERLRAEISSSESALAGLMRDSGNGAGDDEADTGTKNITREHEMSLAANAREMLDQTDRALERLDAGTYGVCENCGNAIGKARMQAFPRATLCVECKQKQERRS
uniref:TraR/DksA family transcriptional regulator n=1 Tax=Streptomyces corallincola TaxID=2851888 RepID=UPI001FE4E8FB|nr:TraR/DksA family transcriptional regulator [Streptomyces corallincola]